MKQEPSTQPVTDIVKNSFEESFKKQIGMEAFHEYIYHVDVEEKPNGNTLYVFVRKHVPDALWRKVVSVIVGIEGIDEVIWLEKILVSSLRE